MYWSYCCGLSPPISLGRSRLSLNYFHHLIGHAPKLIRTLPTSTFWNQWGSKNSSGSNNKILASLPRKSAHLVHLSTSFTTSTGRVNEHAIALRDIHPCFCELKVESLTQELSLLQGLPCCHSNLTRAADFHLATSHVLSRD